jgi:hypothetical protein
MPTIVERVSNARAKVRAGARPLTRAEEKTRRLQSHKDTEKLRTQGGSVLRR